MSLTLHCSLFLAASSNSMQSKGWGNYIPSDLLTAWCWWGVGLISLVYVDYGSPEVCLSCGVKFLVRHGIGKKMFIIFQIKE